MSIAHANAHGARAWTLKVVLPVLAMMLAGVGYLEWTQWRGVHTEAAPAAPSAVQAFQQDAAGSLSAPLANWIADHADRLADLDRAALAEGVEIARARRIALAQRMRANPDAAWAARIPFSVRSLLPQSMQDELETPLRGRARLHAVTFRSLASPNDAASVLQATTGGRTYRAYATNAAAPAANDAVIDGLALDDLLLVGAADAVETSGPLAETEVVWVEDLPEDPAAAMAMGTPSVHSVAEAGPAGAALETRIPWIAFEESEEGAARVLMPGALARETTAGDSLPEYAATFQIPRDAKVAVTVDDVAWAAIGEHASGTPAAGTAESVVAIEDRYVIRGHEFVRVRVAPIATAEGEGAMWMAAAIHWRLAVTPTADAATAPTPTLGPAFAMLQGDAIDLTGGEADSGTAPSEPTTDDLLLTGGDAYPETDTETVTTDATATDVAGGEGGEGFGGEGGDAPKLYGSGGADYLILAHADFVDNTALQAFVTYKQSRGLSVSVVSLDDVPILETDPVHTEVTDDDIRAYLQDVYSTWSPTPTYVLLVGDAELLPPYIDEDASGPVTDLYYAAVDGGDYMPDWHVGRMPCSTATECSAMFNKARILGLANHADHLGFFWANAHVAGVLEDTNNDLKEDRIYLESIEGVRLYMETLGRTVTKSYGRSPQSTGSLYLLKYNGTSILHNVGAQGDYYSQDWLNPYYTLYSLSFNGTATTISNALNNDSPATLIFRGKGSSTGEGWALPSYTRANVQALTNGYGQPAVISLAPNSGAFHESDAFGEEWLKRDSVGDGSGQGGGVLVVAPTETASDYKLGDWFLHGIMQASDETYFSTLYGINQANLKWNNLSYAGNAYGPTEVAGPMIAYAKKMLYDMSPCSAAQKQEAFEIYGLLGDPEGFIPIQPPAPLDATHPSVLAVGRSNTFNVTVTRDGVPHAGATVKLTLAPTEDHTATTNGSGVASFSFNPSTEGDMEILVSAPISLPYQSTILCLQPPEDPVNVTAPVGDVVDQSPTIQWDAVDRAAFYRLVVKQGSTTLFSKDDITTLSYDTELTYDIGTTYTIQIDAGNAAGWGPLTSYTFRPRPPYADVSAVTFDQPSGILSKATTITITASGAGDSRQYRFYGLNPSSGEWELLQDWGALNDNDLAWTPTDEGVWSIRGEARWSESTGGAEDTLSVSLTVYPRITISNFAITPGTGTVEMGNAVTISCDVSGGSGNTELQFWAQNPQTSQWTLVRDYATQTSTGWTPVIYGAWDVRVYARRVGTTVPSDTTDQMFYDVLALPVTVETFSAAIPQPAPINVANTLTATASGGDTPLLYRFYVMRPGGSTWEMIQDWGGDNTVDWTPDAIGVWNLTVWVKETDSTTTTHDDSKGFGINIMPTPVTADSLVANPTSPAAYGQTVSLTATASGGSDIQYEFYVQAPGSSTWTKIQAYSSDNTVDWTPATFGIWQVSCWVKDITSPLFREDAIGITYKVNPPPVSLDSVTANPAGETTIGDTITLTATGSGGSSTLLYKFFVQEPGSSSWTVLQDYSSDNTVEWTPAKVGIWDVSVYIKEQSSTLFRDDALGFSYEILAEAVTLDSLEVAPGSVSHGDTVTLTATGSGGNSTLLYEFYTLAPGGSWTKIQNYSSDNTATFDADQPGLWEVSVYIKETDSVLFKDDSAGAKIDVQPLPVQIDSFTVTPSTPQVLGATVTLTGVGSGGESPLQYKFLAQDPETLVWSEIRAYSTDNTFDYTPGKPGTWQFSIWLKETASPLFRDDVSGASCVIKPLAVSLDSVTKSVASPQPTSTTITLTANGSGGGSTLLYEFYAANRSGGGWVKLQAYSSDNTYDWTPATPGTYDFAVWVKETDSANFRDDQLGFVYVIQ